LPSCRILVIIDTRLKNLFYRSSFIFRRTSHFKREQELLRILHGFTEGIIQKRLDEISQDAENFNTESTKNAEMEGGKREGDTADVSFGSNHGQESHS